jgi:type I restriction enzyme S subunit
MLRMSEMKAECLPSGWALTTLSGVVQPDRPRRNPKDLPHLPFIGMEHVEAHSMRLLEMVPAHTMNSNAVHFQPGDVLYGRLRPYLNKVVRPDFEGLCSAEFIVFSDNGAVEPRFLQYRLNASDFVSFATHLNEGDRPRVDFSQIGCFQIALPPCPEQRRIVAEIEKQFSRLDAAVTALKRVQANLKRYRAAVLRAACEGRLVSTEAELARQEGRDYEPADALLQRILCERRARWEADQLAKLEAQGLLPFNDIWKAKYQEPAAPDTSGLPELPEGWCWARAEQLCDFITKGTTPSENNLFSGDGEVPFIKVYNLTHRGVLDFSINPSFISRMTHQTTLGRSRVVPGNVLMNIVGPPLGKVSIVPALYPEWNVNQAIAIFRPMPSFNRHFLCHCLLTDNVLQWAVKRSKATAGQFNLTLEICRDLPIPLPPLAEQERIVAEVERRLSIVEEVEATVAADLKRAERLRQAILQRAFSGKLVPQDPNDEPASVLLERIRAERVQAESKIRSGRRPARQKEDTNATHGQQDTPGTAVPSGRARRLRDIAEGTWVQPDLFSTDGP